MSLTLNRSNNCRVMCLRSCLGSEHATRTRLAIGKTARSVHTRIVQKLAIPHRLERFVRNVRLFDSTEQFGASPERYRRLPDGESELLVRFDGRKTSTGVVGTRTRAFGKLADGPGGTLLVRFRTAGAYPFFGRPLSQLPAPVNGPNALLGVMLIYS